MVTGISAPVVAGIAVAGGIVYYNIFMPEEEKEQLKREIFQIYENTKEGFSSILDKEDFKDLVIAVIKSELKERGIEADVKIDKDGNVMYTMIPVPEEKRVFKLPPMVPPKQETPKERWEREERFRREQKERDNERSKPNGIPLHQERPVTVYYTEKTKKERGKVKTNTDTSITKIEVETPKIKPVEDIIGTKTGNKELNNAINTRGAEYYLDLRAQKATAPINFNGHIINGEINARGRAVGGHSMLGGNVRIDAYAAKNPISPNGIRNVVISVYDLSTGTWIQKVDRFGEPQLTTLFPENWSKSRIIVEVDIAYKNRTRSLLDPRKWEGRTPSGIKVEGYIAPNTTVYPLQ